MVTLDAPIIEATPMPIRLTAAPIVGERYSAIGFGDPGPDRWPDGRRRIDSLQVICVGGDCPPDDGTSRLDPASEFRGALAGCPGDSGGPAVGDDGAIIGVLSRGTGSCLSPVYERVDVWSAWLTSTLGAPPSTASGTTAGGCQLVGVADDADQGWRVSAVFIAFLAVGLAARRGLTS